jgi:hypothetical protein
MNSDYENELEAQIDRELKTLPPLRAPTSLMPRVMTEIAKGAMVPWHRRSWQTWPVALRVVSMVALATIFSGICFAGWELAHAAVTQEIGGWFAGLSVVWRTASVLADAAELAIRHLGKGFIIACLAAAILGYAAFLALGTAYVKLAFARR